MTRRAVHAVLVALLFVVLVAGCGDDDDDGGGGGGGTEIEETVAERSLPEAAVGTPAGELLLNTESKQKYKIGIALPNLPDPIWQAMARGQEDYAQDLGVDVEILDAGGYTEVDRQIAQVEDLIQSQVDGIVLAAVDPAALTPVVKKAQAKGIPVVTFLVGVEPGVALADVNEDLEKVGELECQAVAEENPTARVVMLSGPAGVQSAELRRDGFEKCAKESGMTILSEQFSDSNREEALRLTEDALVAHGDEIDAIFTFSSFMALGVNDVLRREGRTEDIFVVTTSPSEEAIDGLFAGEIDAAVREYVVIVADAALAAVVANLNGEDVPEFVETPLSIATPEGAPKEDWYWEVPDYEPPE